MTSRPEEGYGLHEQPRVGNQNGLQPGAGKRLPWFAETVHVAWRHIQHLRSRCMHGCHHEHHRACFVVRARFAILSR